MQKNLFRLKIGAKSKKDPHIRVGGQEEGVKIAKARITEVLDTRVNRYNSIFGKDIIS